MTTRTSPRSRWARATIAGVTALVVLGLAGCGDPPAESASNTSHARASTTTTVPSTTSTAAATTTTTAPPTFTWRVTAIDAPLRTRMATSWHNGCPIAIDSLRYVSLVYWGFDGKAHMGELVVNADAVGPLERAFSSLFDQRFPIRSMRLIDDFGGSDDQSMAADNTSAFNCRSVAGSSRWSQHAFGRAVDINPVENPYIHNGIIDPPAAVAFADRSAVRPGMLLPDSEAVAAFTAVGWGWGGSWSSPDHQHVSATGS